MQDDFPTLIAAFQRLWVDPQRAAHIALSDESRQLSYADLHKAVGQLAGQLRAAGVQRGDRVALALQRSCGLAVAILAVMAAGGCPCPLEPKLGSDETARRYRVARIDWTLLDELHSGEESLNQVPPQQRLHIHKLPDAAPWWDSTLQPQDAGFLLFTSGSSGKPKGVLHNHRGMLLNARGVLAHTELTPADRLLLLMPLYHTNGVNNQLLTPLLAGASVHVAGRFRAEDVPALLVAVQPSIVTGVPTMFSRMLSQDFTPESLASLRVLRCGSAPITEELHKRIEAKFGLPLVVSYGLSEATCTSTMNPPARRKIGSVGMPLAGQDVFLRSASGQRISEPGRDGEICIAGPSLMSGYLDETSAGLPQAVGAVLHSGDLGRFDDEGYLFITGRIKEVIIRGGENLSPKLIEEAITAVPGVADCCVVGRADADLGEVPVAFVVRQPAANPAVQSQQLAAAVLARLSRIHQPADYVFVDALPENSVGKVDRKKLAQSLAATPA